jgi:hypothetical protein
MAAPANSFAAAGGDFWAEVSLPTAEDTAATSVSFNFASVLLFFSRSASVCFSVSTSSKKSLMTPAPFCTACRDKSRQ